MPFLTLFRFDFATLVSGREIDYPYLRRSTTGYSLSIFPLDASVHPLTRFVPSQA